MSHLPALTKYYNKLRDVGSYEGLFNPLQVWSNKWGHFACTTSQELVRANLWFYFVEKRFAKVAIVDDRGRFLDLAFSGIAMTHPQEMKAMGAAYRVFKLLTLQKPVHEQHKSKLSRMIHAGVNTSGKNCILLNLYPFVPTYIGADSMDERELEFSEHQKGSKYTIDVLKALDIPIIVLSKRAQKILKLAKIDSTLLVFKPVKGWDTKLAAAIKKLVK